MSNDDGSSALHESITACCNFLVLSLTLSKLDVASSNMRIGGSLRSARAMAILCF